MTSDRQCSAMARSGKPCQSPPMTGQEFCFTHHPESQERRNEARKRGGQNSSRVARLERSLADHPSLGNVVQTLASTLDEVRRGALSPGIGNSVASLSRAMISAIEAAEAGARIADLEAAIDRILEGDGLAPGLRVVS